MNEKDNTFLMNSIFGVGLCILSLAIFTYLYDEKYRILYYIFIGVSIFVLYQDLKNSYLGIKLKYLEEELLLLEYKVIQESGKVKNKFGDK